MSAHATPASKIAKIWLRHLKRAAVDKAWIERVRKSWKSETQRVMAAGASDKVSKIEGLWGWLDRFATDLAFSKGWYQPNPAEDDMGDTELRRIRTKAISLSADTLAVLKDGLSRMNFFDQVVTPGTQEFRMDGGRLHREFSEDPRGLEKTLADNLRAVADETIKKADAVFSGKLLRHLTSVTSKWGPVELEDGFELAFSVGRVKVTVEEFESWKPGPHDPVSRRNHGDVTRAYVKELSTAEQLLDRSGLGFLWYGNMLIRCKTCGGENFLGAQFGVGGDYSIAKDEIHLYNDPVPGLYRLVIHELGHRYYFKFMTPADRAEFDSYFKTVPATTSYGATVSAEDFAEVFADYVLRKDLSRDQIERFKKFLGRKKTGSSEDLEGFLQGFLQRHPILRKVVPGRIRIRIVEKTGAGVHGEARQHGDEIWLFPKFWALDTKTKDWVLTHEIGHWALREFGLSKMIAAASGLGIDPWDLANLPYGQHNMDEAFADCFAAHVLDPAELKHRYPQWIEIVDQVKTKTRIAGDVVELGKRRPNVPTLKIQGRAFVLSTYGDAMGDAMDADDETSEGARLIRVKPSNPWKYLWAYDTDRKFVEMWRVSDGDSKSGGSASRYTREVLMLEKKGQLNRVDRSTFDMIDRYMRQQHDSTMESLRKLIEEQASDEERKITPLLYDYFAKVIAPEFEEKMQRWKSGVKPLGFRAEPLSALGEARQLASWTLGTVTKEFWQEDKIEKYLKDHGIQMELLGNQDVYFAMNDVYFEASAPLIREYDRDHLASTRLATRWLLSKVDFEKFKESIKDKKFRNPETDNEVQFKSLPVEEQSRIFQDWKRRQGPQEKQRDDARGLVPVDRKKAREVADSIAEKLSGMKFRDEDESLFNNRSQPWPVKLPRVQLFGVKGKREFWVPVEVDIGEAPEDNWKMSRKYVAGGKAVHRHLGKDDSGYPMQVNIKLDRDRTPAELAKDSKRVSDEIYHVLIHELTHAADVMPTPKQKEDRARKDEAGKSDSQKYHNKPEEVRAFKRQIAEEVEDRMKELFDSEEDPDWIDQNANIVRNVLDSSKTWERIRKDLTPENRKSVLKTIADVVRRYKEQRGGKTATDVT